MHYDEMLGWGFGKTKCWMLCVCFQCRKQFRLFVKFYLNLFPCSSCCFIELIAYCNMMSHNVSFQIDQYCVFLSLGLWKLFKATL